MEKKEIRRVISLMLSILLIFSVTGTVGAAENSTVIIKKTGSVPAGSNKQLRNVAAYGNYIYASVRDDRTGGVAVYDISKEPPVLVTTTEQKLIGHTHVDSASNLLVSGDYLYVAFMPDSTAATPAEIRKFYLKNTPENPEYIATYASTTTRLHGIGIFGDKMISGEYNSSHITLWDNSATTYQAEAVQPLSSSVVAYSGSPKFMCYGSQVYLLNYNNSWNLLPLKIDGNTVSRYDYVTGPFYGGEIHPDGYMYLAKSGELLVIDITDGYTSVYDGKKKISIPVSTFGTSNIMAEISGDYLYMASTGRIYVFDISNPASPVLVNDSTEIKSSDIAAKDGKIYTCEMTRNADVSAFEMTDYLLKMSSEKNITALPFILSGPVLDGSKLTMRIKSDDMEKAKEFELTPSDNTWSHTLSNIYDGEYSVKLTITEVKEEILSQEYTLTVDLEKYGVIPERTNKIQNEIDAETITIAEKPIDYSTDTIAIKGKVPMGDRIGFKEVTLKITDPNGTEIFNEKQKSLGNYDFTVALGENPVENKDYTISVSAEEITQQAAEVFRYYGPEFIQNVIDVVNSATKAEEIENAILEFNGLMELPVFNGTDYDTLKNKVFAQNYLIGKNFANLTQIREEFAEGVAEQKLREAKISEIALLDTVEKIETAILENAELLGADVTSNSYIDLTETAKKALYEEILNDEDLTEEEIVKLFSHDDCLLRLLNMSTSLEIGSFLLKYKTVLGLDVNMIEKYEDELDEDALSIVNKNLARMDKSEYFKTLREAKELFNKTVEEAENQDKDEKDSDRGKGSSGGGAGGRISASSATTPITDNKDTQQEKAFNDLENVAWAVPAIEYLAEKGIINGKSETEFAPNDSLTREEFVKMLIALSGEELSDNEITFSDADSSAWYYPYIITAVKLGIVNGVSEDRFGVGEKLTREQMAVMLLRYMEARNMKSESIRKADFKDEISEYAIDAVNTLYEIGIMNGTGESEFDAFGVSTRAMGAKVLYELWMLGEGR